MTQTGIKDSTSTGDRTKTEENGNNGKKDNKHEKQKRRKKVEERKGIMGWIMDFLFVVVVSWLILNIIKSEKKLGLKKWISSAHANNRSAHKMGVPKPASLPDPPPSPVQMNTGKAPSPTNYDQYENLIFVGGLPGGGTSLMRAILDAHPDVRCGDARGLLGLLMSEWRNIWQSKFQMERMRMSGVKEGVVDISMKMFILEFMVNSGPSAPRLCVRDPSLIFGGRYLLHLFVNSKMVVLIRDLRAAAYSFRRKKKKSGDLNFQSLEKTLTFLDEFVTLLRKECIWMGVDRCLPVRYEDLVINPRATMEEVLRFLDLPWREEVLHHYYYANKTGVFSFPDSNDTTPIYQSSLTSWVGNIPSYLNDFHSYYFRNLEYLGYDPGANPPDYSKLPPYNWTMPTNEVLDLHKKDVKYFKMLMAKAAAQRAGLTRM